jgi:UDP-2,4-diacetamido-2,4,6-trideoxy-beta-L-altropyranose hydrolase
MTGRRRAIFILAAGKADGLGHLRRCVALARAVEVRQTDSLFLVDGPAESCGLLGSYGFQAQAWHGRGAAAATHILGSDAVVVDSYHWCGDDVSELRGSYSGRLVILDDLADRRLSADVVVNGAASAAALAYDAMPIGKRLLGPRFVLLQPEFAVPPVIIPAETIDDVIVLAGGGSSSGPIAGDFASVVRTVFPEARIECVVGPFSEPGAPQPHVTWRRSPPDLFDRMKRADLAVSSAGQTMYELAALAVPAVIVATAPNQVPGAAGMADCGAVRYAGLLSSAIWRKHLVVALAELTHRPDRRALSERARAAVDGCGAARVAEAILE